MESFRKLGCEGVLDVGLFGPRVLGLGLLGLLGLRAFRAEGLG